MNAPFLPILLFLSGAGSLVLEVCWFRRLAQIVGATSVAMAAVLAAVIGGMAAGAFLVGRIADRSRRPARLYAGLEVGIAAAALLTPWLLTRSEAGFDLLAIHLAGAPARLAAAQFLFAALLLALPAMLMGGSLPAAACAAGPAPEDRGRILGRLYSANTLGAVAGTLAAGFLLIPALGLADATHSAALLSAAAAIGAFRLRGGRAADGAPAAAADRAPTPGVRRAIALYAASGFLGLAAEVAFTRHLVLVFGSSTYAFTTVLAVLLLGIGIGGAVGAGLARRADRHLERLESTVAVTAALLSLASLAVFALPRLYLLGVAGWAQGFTAGILLRFALSLLVLLPGAIGLGIAFPLAAHLAAAGALGDGTGRLYAANTLGSVAGSTAAVFLLVPSLDAHYTVAAVAVVVAALAAGRRRLLPALGLLAAAAGLLPPGATARERLLSGVYFRPDIYLVGDTIDERAWADGADLPFVAYGRDATVAVQRWYGTSGLLIDGKAVASNEIVADVQHLSLLGHIPMALVPDPERVLVVGLGMGTTFSACRDHAPATLRVVELEPAVVRAAAFLGVMPADLVVADARTYLRTTREQWDVITSDPIHPWVRGGGDLYTREYLESARARLSARGVFCQWVPLHQMGVEDVRLVVRTFCRVFPAVQAYWGAGDLILIGGDTRPLPAPRRLSGRPAEALGALGIADLAALRVADRDRLLAAAGEGPVLTDDALRLEFSTPRYLDNPALADCFAWVQALWRDAPAPWDRIIQAEVYRTRGLDTRMWQVLGRALREHPDNAFLLRRIGELYLDRVEEAMGEDDMDVAAASLARAAKFLPGDPRVPGVEADLRIAQGRPEEARPLLEGLLRQDPGSVWLRRRIDALGR